MEDLDLDPKLAPFVGRGRQLVDARMFQDEPLLRHRPEGLGDEKHGNVLDILDGNV